MANNPFRMNVVRQYGQYLLPTQQQQPRQQQASSNPGSASPSPGTSRAPSPSTADALTTYHARIKAINDLVGKLGQAKRTLDEFEHHPKQTLRQDLTSPFGKRTGENIDANIAAYEEHLQHLREVADDTYNANAQAKETWGSSHRTNIGNCREWIHKLSTDIRQALEGPHRDEVGPPHRSEKKYIPISGASSSRGNTPGVNTPTVGTQGRITSQPHTSPNGGQSVPPRRRRSP